MTPTLTDPPECSPTCEGMAAELDRARASPSGDRSGKAYTR